MHTSAAIRCAWLWFLVGACSDEPFDAKLGGPLGQATLLSASHQTDFACSTTRPVAVIEKSGFDKDVLLIQLEAGAFLVSTQSDPTLGDFGTRIIIEPVDDVGDRGATRTIAEGHGFTGGFSAVNRDGRWKLLWIERDPRDVSRIHLATLDETGEVVDVSNVVPGVTGTLQEALIAPAEDGFALMWTQYDETLTSTLSFVRLDESGDVRSQPKVLSRSANDIALRDFVAFGDGFAVIYDEWEGPSNGHFAVLDAEGTPQNGPLILGQGANGGSLLVRGDEVLIAYTLRGIPYLRANAAAEVRLARFDAKGKRRGHVHALDRAGWDRYFAHPKLVPFGEDVAIWWSEGTVIHICGGCEPNNILKFALLTGQDPKPASNVIELKNPLDHGGLLEAQAVQNDASLVLLTNIEFHTTSQLASAVIRCEPHTDD